MKIISSFFIIIFSIAAPAFSIVHAADNTGEAELETLSRQLAQMENQVQLLYDQVENRTDNLRNKERLFLARKAEIESDIQRKNLKLKQIRQEFEKQTEILKAKSEEHSDVVPVVLNGISSLRQYIESALPFKRKERLAQLEDLQNKISPEHPVLLPERALNTLWAYYEDEIRICREHGIYKQTIKSGRGNVLADVVKIGMMGMFYLTPNKEAGIISLHDGSYVTMPLRNERDVELVTALMDDFRKQIRTGYFVLPDFLSGVRGLK